MEAEQEDILVRQSVREMWKAWTFAITFTEGNSSIQDAYRGSQPFEIQIIQKMSQEDKSKVLEYWKDDPSESGPKRISISINSYSKEERLVLTCLMLQDQFQNDLQALDLSDKGKNLIEELYQAVMTCTIAKITGFWANCHSFVEMVCKTDKIKSMDIQALTIGTNIGDKTIYLLLEQLQKQNILKQLKAFRLGNESLQGLNWTYQVSNNSKFLEERDVQQGFQQEISEECITFCVDTLSRESRLLEYVSIQSKMLSDSSINIFLPLLRLKTLKIVEITNSKLTDLSTDLLVKLLNQLPELKKVNLQKNQFGKQGTTTLKQISIPKLSFSFFGRDLFSGLNLEGNPGLISPTKVIRKISKIEGKQEPDQSCQIF